MNEWDEVLAFWFPPGGDSDFETHRKHMEWCFRGGADDAIVARFSELTAKGVAGKLDHWAATPDGRMALILVLDQFPRSVYRGTPAAYAQDQKALNLTLEGLDNGHYEALTVWQKTFFTLPFAHAEGPDHLQRVDRLIELGGRVLEEAPAHLKPLYAFAAQQQRDGRKVIERFGRHPHRNEILGRESTPEELEYLRAGDFIHTRTPSG